MIRRRDLIIGAGALVAAGSAEAMRPRNRMSLVGKSKLADAIPLQFGDWRQMDTKGIVAPESDNSLANQLYSEQVGRLYVRGDDYVMLLIAYGNTQNDLLQLHRPEVCYPAFGFQVTSTQTAQIALAPGIDIPGRRLSADSPGRTEHISYWTRIGEYLPVDGNEQRWMKLKTAFAGIIPDGVLCRFSSSAGDPASSFALNESFAGAMIQAMRPALRPALITTQKARDLAARLNNS